MSPTHDLSERNDFDLTPVDDMNDAQAPEASCSISIVFTLAWTTQFIMYCTMHLNLSISRSLYWQIMGTR